MSLISSPSESPLEQPTPTNSNPTTKQTKPILMVSSSGKDGGTRCRHTTPSKAPERGPDPFGLAFKDVRDCSESGGNLMTRCVASQLSSATNLRGEQGLACVSVRLDYGR